MIDIFNLQENKVTSNLGQYSVVIGSVTGNGKTTTMHNILKAINPDEKKKPLFLCSENRFRHIPGIMAIFIKNYAELQMVTNQLLDPRAKELYSCVVFDTIDRFDSMIETYNADAKGVQITGDLAYGRGNKYIKSSLQLINKIRNAGWITHFCVQFEISKDLNTQVETLSLAGINKETWRLVSQDAYLIGNLTMDSKEERWLTFKKTTASPILKDSIGFPSKVNVKNFKDEFMKAVEKMAGGKDKLVDEAVISNSVIDTRDFETIKARGNELGGILANNGFLDEAMNILAHTIGTDEDGNPKMFDSLIASQIDLADVVVQQLEILAKSKGLQV